jgi:hypothetical protein
VAQLGAGFGSQYPTYIDTKQTYRNLPAAVPDSDTRLDAEALNDMLAAIVQVETALGANPGGAYGSLAARLAQFLPGGAAIPNVLGFTGQSTVVLPGAVHRQQSQAILYQAWDTATPRNAVQPNSVTVDPTSYDFTMSFGLPQSGTVVLGAPSPLYTTRFTNLSTLVIPGTAHGLAFNKLFYQVYDAGTPAAAIQPGPLTIDAATRDVTLYFAVAQSGILVLSAGGPRYEVAFSGVSSLTIPGSVHGLGSSALLYQLYDAGTPPAAFHAPATVHPTTFDVTVNLGVPQSGTLILTRVTATTGQEFDIRDTGQVNQTAVRVYSDVGTLRLQAGGLDAVTIRNKFGADVATFATATGRLGIGTATPAFQLQLSTGPAAKPDGTLWTVASDVRLKTVLGPFTDGLAVLEQLAPVRFLYNGQGGIPATTEAQIGFVAQDVQPVAPYLVGSYPGRLTPEDAEDTAILTYEGHALAFVLLNAVRELAARLTALEVAHDALTVAYEALRGAMDSPPPEELPT